jgi:hypothetical protein
MKNMYETILELGRMQQNIFFLFENVLNFFLIIFLKYFGENRVF